MTNTQCKPTNALRYRHHFLSNGGVLTVCTNLRHDSREVDVGWSVFNPQDQRWIKKKGCEIARNRLFNNKLYFSLTKDEPILCDYISFRALALLLVVSGGPVDCYNPNIDDHPAIIPQATRTAMQLEMIEILNLVGKRGGLEDIYC